MYEAGQHGGELVYAYACGVGIRSGDPKDVERLLVAATYHQAQIDRKAGRADDAASLIALTAKRLPSDPEMQMFAVESLLVDRKNPQGAIDALAALTAPEGCSSASTRSKAAPCADRHLTTRRGTSAFTASNTASGEACASSCTVSGCAAGAVAALHTA